MTENYFAIERNGECIEHVVLRDYHGNISYEHIMDMSYEEMLLNDDEIQEFVVMVMDATNEWFDEEDEQTAITLVGPDGVFIWGIIMGPNDDGSIHYEFINWQTDGRRFRYEQENEDFFEKGIDKLN